MKKQLSEGATRMLVALAKFSMPTPAADVAMRAKLVGSPQSRAANQKNHSYLVALENRGYAKKTTYRNRHFMVGINMPWEWSITPEGLVVVKFLNIKLKGGDSDEIPYPRPKMN